MRNKITVSVGIPTYNEEANIRLLLTSLLDQKQEGYLLENIIITSDASTDNSLLEIKKVRSNKIILIKNKKRLGQALSQNKIIGQNKSDYLVILNADILITDKLFIKKMILPMLLDAQVGIVSPQILPLRGSHMFEKIINYSVILKKNIYVRINTGNNIYMCHGRARAFSSKIFKTIKWPSLTAEDAYSYLYCIEQGLKFTYQPKAAIYYKSPVNYKDHRFQSSRFLISHKEVTKYFPNDFVNKEYSLPLVVVLTSIFKYFVVNPFYFIAYAFILFTVKFFNRVKVRSMWDIAESSKRLYFQTKLRLL